jgi:uncharacterized protein (UPF0333 family)
MRKGQAALEFLMTYGWAILAAIIVIGVLAYFGVFSPGRYAPNACAVTAPFYCNAWNARAATGVTIELKNNGGEAYTISSVDVTNCGTQAGSTPIAADATATITVACSPALTEGDSFKGDITITYTKSGSIVNLTSTGSISQKVTA